MAEERDTVRIVRVSELAGRPPVEEVIPGVLDDGIILLAAKEGTGKTFFAVHMGAVVASGSRWRGRKVKKGMVVYCIAEGVSFFPHRVTTAFDHIGVRAKDQPFYVLDRSINLRCGDDGKPSEEVEWLIAEIEGAAAAANIKCRLVIFDTLNRYMPGGDENNQKDAGALIRGCEHIRTKLGCAVMLVHHLRKDQDLVRGSTVLTAAADEVLTNKMYGEQIIDGPMVWETGEKGKRKDHGPVEEWIQMQKTLLSDGNLIDRDIDPTGFDFEDHFMKISEVNDEGEKVETGQYEEVLVVKLIDKPDDPAAACPIGDDARKIIDLLRDAPEPLGVRAMISKLRFSQSKLYKIIDVLKTRGLIAQGSDKKYRYEGEAVSPFGG